MIEFLEVIIPLLIAFIGILIPAIRLYLDNRKLKNENNNLNEKIKDLMINENQIMYKFDKYILKVTN